MPVSFEKAYEGMFHLGSTYWEGGLLPVSFEEVSEGMSHLGSG